MNVKLYWENIIEYFEEEEWPLHEVNEEEAWSARGRANLNS